MNWSRFFKYTAVALVLALLVLLSGWYVYLRTQTTAIQEADEGRGFGQETPLPSNSLGSMFSNLATRLRGGGSNSSLPGQNESFVEGGGFFRSIYSRLTGGGTSSFTTSVKDALGGLVPGLTSGEAPLQKPRPPRLSHAHETPISGIAFVAATTTLRFLERATGHLFDISPETGDIRRVSNTLIPKAFSAVFAHDGSILAEVFSENGQRTVVSGVVATSSDASGATNLEIEELGEGFLAIAASSTARHFAALVEEVGGFALVSAGWGGESPTRLAGTALSGWRLFWTNGGVVAAQAPASGVPGYAYSIEENGSFAPLVRALPGLTFLPNASGEAFLAGSDNGALALFVSTTSPPSLIQLPIQTTADKCAWVSDSAIAYCAVPERLSSARFLDDWYQGNLHTEDAWWRINAEEGTAELLFSPFAEAGMSLDVMNPRIDDKGEYLAFMDARDQSLWVLRIAE